MPDMHTEDVGISTGRVESSRYPGINWADLPQRVKRYIPWLRKCLESHDMPVLRKEYIKSSAKLEHNRYLVENSRSGYYGPRGEDLM